MTNEFAIECIKDFKKSFGIYTYDADIKELIVALDMAIKALEQQPSEDCISRQAVIQIIENKLNPCTDMFKCLEMSEIKEDVEHLPPVTPERPKGKWNRVKEPNDFYYECSECGKRMNWLDEDDYFCPSCGSYNGGEDE